MTSLHAAAGPRPLRLLILHVCVNIRACMRSGTAVRSTGPNADAGKRQRGRNAAWSVVTYGWHCDMIGIPAVRHSDTETDKQTNRPIFIYRSWAHWKARSGLLISVNNKLNLFRLVLWLTRATSENR